MDRDHRVRLTAREHHGRDRRSCHSRNRCRREPHQTEADQRRQKCKPETPQPIHVDPPRSLDKIAGNVRPKSSHTRVRSSRAIASAEPPLLQDVHGAGHDHHGQRQADRRLHEHQHLRPAAERHRVGRAERRRVRERHVQIVEEHRCQPESSSSGSVCCGNRKSRAGSAQVRRSIGPPPSSCQNQSANSSTFTTHMCTAARSKVAAFAWRRARAGGRAG